MSGDTEQGPSWQRVGDRPWYWRATLRFLTDLPDRTEPLDAVFRRHQHASLGAGRMALDHISYLVELGEVPAEATVSDAIRLVKQLHKVGAMPNRDSQRG